MMNDKDIKERALDSSQTRRVVIAYHANCIDGFTAYWITAKFVESTGSVFIPLPMEYNEASYKKLLYSLEENEAHGLIVVDFSLPVSLIVNLNKLSIPIKPVIIDHHKTAMDNYHIARMVKEDEKARYPFTQVDSEQPDFIVVAANHKSGARLCLDYYEPALDEGFVRTAEPMVSYVEAYDLWDFKLKGKSNVKQINAYLSNLPCRSLEQWDIASTLIKNTEEEILLIGHLLLRKQAHKVAAKVLTADPITIGGYLSLAVQVQPSETKACINDIASALCSKTRTFGATYCIDTEANIIKWSLRSDKDATNIDVSAIAKSLGGGGHRNAAGFETVLIPESSELATLTDKSTLQ